MKHGVRPTRAQKKLIQKWDLAPSDWLVVKDTPDMMLIVHRHSDSTFRRITKEK